MSCLEITEEGKLCISDYRSIHKAVLQVLLCGPVKIIDLVGIVKYNYHEFKYTDTKVIVNAIGELIKAKLVISRYGDE